MTITHTRSLFGDVLRSAIAMSEQARFAEMCCDKPDDRMWHAKDNSWWRRVGNRWVSCDPPNGWIYLPNDEMNE